MVFCFLVLGCCECGRYRSRTVIARCASRVAFETNPSAVQRSLIKRILGGLCVLRLGLVKRSDRSGCVQSQHQTARRSRASEASEKIENPVRRSLVTRCFDSSRAATHFKCFRNWIVAQTHWLLALANCLLRCE